VDIFDYIVLSRCKVCSNPSLSFGGLA